jgi:hypothetical protein
VRRDECGWGAGRDVTRARTLKPLTTRKVRAMNRFVAPLSFTLAAAWVVVLFVMVHNAP